MAAGCEAGTLVHGLFIVGLPGKLMRPCRRHCKFGIQLKLETVQFYPVMVYPGTVAYDWYQ